MFMALQVIAKPGNESETTSQINMVVGSIQSYFNHGGPTAGTPPGVQNGVLCLVCLEKNDKEPKFPNSDTPLPPCRKPAGNGLKWLQGFPCRGLQTCFLIPARNRNTLKSLQYFLTCWDMEGAYLEMSKYRGPWEFSVLILLQLAITLRLGRNKFKSLLCNGFSLWLLWP